MNNEFEEKGYKLVDLNFGFEDLMVKSFENQVRVFQIQPTQNPFISSKSMDVSMEYVSSIVHRDYLTSIVEKEIDLKLIPTFCCVRKYFKGSTLNMHRDRDPCEITLSYCIFGPEWEIIMGHNTVITKIGSGVIYKGCETSHGRIKPSPDEVIQVMNCWVISGGVKSNSAYSVGTDDEQNKDFYLNNGLPESTPVDFTIT